MHVLRCLMCEEPVLGGPRWEVRLCGTGCATDALFEVVRLSDELDHGTADEQTSQRPAVQLIEEHGLVHRRALLMRATLAWQELDEARTPGGVPAPAAPTPTSGDDHGQVAETP